MNERVLRGRRRIRRRTRATSTRSCADLDSSRRRTPTASRLAIDRMAAGHSAGSPSAPAEGWTCSMRFSKTGSWRQRVVVVVVPLVLDRLHPPHRGDPAAACHAAAARGLRPWLWLAPALDVPGRLPRLPDDRDDLPQLPEPARRRVRRPRQLPVVLQPGRHAHRAAEQRPVGDPRCRSWSSRSACSSPSSSTGSATRASVKSVVFLPLAISFVAAARDLEVHVRPRPERRDAQRRS